MLGFVVWQVWSVTVVKLNDVGFGFTQSQLCGTSYWEPALIAAVCGIGANLAYSMVNIGFYATCLAVCRWFYARNGAEAPS
ncbi:hypothetical protein ACFV0H_08110 [Streptomyces erythrochromogenes]|uniref:hypothetical protein n=1 Tax=Streptomyces erythrochromogenes TaxID=285574 RepID=UPI00369B31E3